MTASTPVSKPRLLIVDDERAHLDALCATLCDRGYETVGFTDGAQALRAVENDDFDLLLIDLMMPGMDGIELLRRALEINPALVGIIMTGGGSIASAVQAMRSGAVDYILKPFSLSDLLPVLSRALIVRTLRVDNAALQADLRERSDELEKINARLRKIDQQRAKFVATVSHELRTPLNAVIGLVDLLLEDINDAHQKELLRIVHTSGQHLLSVITEILDFSKIDAGKLELDHQPFDVCECIEHALELVAHAAAEKGIEMAYFCGESVPATLVGDGNRVREILVNYLSNAVKFTERGEVAVHVDNGVRLPDGRHEVHFAVRDTGAGISPDQMKYLFMPFSQVTPEAASQTEGTGLGLVICKRLAELMGGRVWADSEEGRGTTFNFTIVAPAESSQAAKPDPALEGLRLLIVDDNPTSCRHLRALTTGWGIRVRATTQPQEALDWLNHGERFDLALVDQRMPELSGPALGPAIHLIDPVLPLILLSPIGAERKPGDFAGVISKPVRREVLRRVLLDSAGQPAASEAETDRGKADSLAALRILVVEDNNINQMVVTLMLQALGCHADVVDNGKDAVEVTAQRTYDLILMDMQMPVMDGPTAAHTIQARLPEPLRPRIVAITASSFDSDRDRCLAAGMHDFISKPFQKNRIAEVLDDALAYKAMHA